MAHLRHLEIGIDATGCCKAKLTTFKPTISLVSSYDLVTFTNRISSISNAIREV